MIMQIISRLRNRNKEMDQLAKVSLDMDEAEGDTLIAAENEKVNIESYQVKQVNALKRTRHHCVEETVSIW